ncbi:5553_t:CDS:2 [Funneliformis geosporum]|uniref:5553_t:CDS:1 n=1 Tax=Funneliformis geosporum TaxID=1117311 RepID=A0A9W4SB39_9GLOM|nr:5553_t:CDS:2 [Funneliformis geosporum]
MVMEHMKEGNLQQYLQKNCQKLSFSDKLNQLNDIAKGLKDIHQQKLIHCDFHSGNILYPPCSIADLGLCRSTNEENRGEKIFGVLPYVAPEVLQGKLYTQASDIYSFGMVAYEVLTGLTPYHNSSHDTDLSGKSTEFIRQIQAAEEFNEKLSEEVRHPDYIKPTNTRQISKQIYGTKDLDLEINFDLDELNLQETIQEKSSAKAQIEQLPK